MNMCCSGGWCARVARLQSSRSVCCCTRFWVKFLKKNKQFLDRICRLLICPGKLLFFYKQKWVEPFSILLIGYS